MIDINRAMLNPNDVFDNPEAVYQSTELSVDDKVRILKQWEYDEREMSVAEEENMAGDNNRDLLRRIHNLLRQLNAQDDDSGVHSKA